ncbi:MAG: 4-hydroxy-tetrahydrodipicolinate synthase [Rickettsiales bacterium]
MNLGLISAMPTFFTLNNEIDYKNMHKMCEMQINAGIKSILIGGSTGELLSLKEEEYLNLLKYIVDNFSNKINIIGCVPPIFSNSNEEIIKKILDIGINKVLCATPAYLKPNQTCIFEYFSKIAEKIKVILYSVPSRTGADISVDNICKLSHNNNIVGFKDAGSDIIRVSKIKQYLLKHNQKLELFSGNDVSYLGFCAQGGDGIISVVSNLLPKMMVKIQKSIEQNNFILAAKDFFAIFDVMQALEYDTNPIAIKYLMHKIYIEQDLNPMCRPPLQYIQNDIKEYIKQNNILDLVHKFI